MADTALTIGLPSKGRLKEQTEAWLQDCGFSVHADGGERGYSARLGGLPGAEVQFLPASDIAAALDAGELHLGVTGEDLLRERGEDLDSRVFLLRGLGFGRADLVVAAPRSWIDVDVMADVEEVAAAYLQRTGRRLRVATKYLAQTRKFFAEAGVIDYRIVESTGATEGAPQAGAAELVVDITTTGATLRSNGLKVLDDGVILRSEAQLAAAFGADWSAAALASLRRLMGAVEARGRARKLRLITWPADQAERAEAATERFIGPDASRRTNGLLADVGLRLEIAEALSGAKVGPVSSAQPEFAFEPASEAVEAFAAQLRARI